MKLCRIGELGKEKPAIIDKDGSYKDLSSMISDLNPESLNFETIEKIKKLNIKDLPTLDANSRIGACVKNPSKFLGIGLNFKDHATEQNLPIPKEPIIFSKFTNCIVGPNDNIEVPKNSNHTDWEVEIGFVIGKKAKYVEEKNTLNYVLGFFLVTDVSEREFQLERSGQWVKGKSCDSFAPIGPFIATSDEIKDPNNLKLWLKLNGQTLQNSSTSDFIFNVEHVVSYISQYMSLLPGDIISTGTPSGVGLGLNPPRFLKEGDVVELGVENLGIARQVCKNHNDY